MNTVRLRKLLKTGERILAKKQPLGFGAEKFDCSTYACLGGYYCRTVRNGKSLRHLNALAAHFAIPYSAAQKLFGYADSEANVPGEAAYAELTRRLATLRTMLERQP